MEEKSLDFIHFEVIYIREGISNKWTRRVERKGAATNKIGAPMAVSFYGGQSKEDAKYAYCQVNIKCDPLLNDPNTLMVPEAWRPYEEDAVNLTDKKFKKRLPEAELAPFL